MIEIDPRWREGLHLVPEHMRGAITRWIENGIRPGTFLTAVLSNQLKESFICADETNAAAMRNWVRFIYDYAPPTCHGSPQRVAAWIAGHNPHSDADGGR